MHFQWSEQGLGSSQGYCIKTLCCRRHCLLNTSNPRALPLLCKHTEPRQLGFPPTATSSLSAPSRSNTKKNTISAEAALKLHFIPLRKCASFTCERKESTRTSYRQIDLPFEQSGSKVQIPSAFQKSIYIYIYILEAFYSFSSQKYFFLSSKLKILIHFTKIYLIMFLNASFSAFDQSYEWLIYLTSLWGLSKRRRHVAQWRERQAWGTATGENETRGRWTKAANWFRRGREMDFHGETSTTPPLHEMPESVGSESNEQPMAI